MNADKISSVKGLTTNEAFVLFVLAEYENNETRYSYPGINLIASITRLNERTIRYILDTLIIMGVIEVVDCGTKRNKRYLIRWDAIIGTRVVRPSDKVRFRKSELAPGALEPQPVPTSEQEPTHIATERKRKTASPAPSPAPSQEPYWKQHTRKFWDEMLG